MSKISATTGYDGQLRLNLEPGHEPFTYNWDSHTVTFNSDGFQITTEFELTKEQKIQLAGSLAKKDPALTAEWTTLSTDLQRLIERIVDQILEGASRVDNSLRKLSKGLRLAPLQFRERSSPGGRISPVIYWQFSEEERELLKPIFEKLGTASLNGYTDGIEIPMPLDFERRQVHLSDTEIEQIKKYFENPASHEPFRALYSIAADNFLDRYYDSAVMILATSIETALKWWLVKNGDPISEYILTNVQSPPIDKLYSCARKNTTITLPKHFSAWLVQLRNTRNDIAHKPEGKEINFLELSRWFAVGEAILGAISGHDIDPLVGCIVEPNDKSANDDFPLDSKGVVIRREVLHNDISYHILLDSGVTCRLNENTFEKSKQQSF